MRVIAISIAALSLLEALALAQAGEKRKYMSDITARAAAKIAEFEEKKETVPLQAASELLAEVNLAKEPDPMKRLLLRREALETWLALVAAIDKNLDPSFNPQDVPSVKISPPVSGGADPQSRQQYEQATQQNREKAQRYMLQTKLRRLDEMVTPRVERYVRLSYTTVPGDQREVAETVKKLIENPQRASALTRAASRQ
jgi:hypothetical protein